MRILSFFALITFVFDQASKVAVVHWLDLKHRLVLEVFPPFLTLRMGWNTGINFGLFSGAPEFTRWLLIAIALCISVFLIYWSRKTFHQKRAFACTGLIIGGALANVLDRIIYGAVADFLNMSCCGFVNPYTFNLADVFIFVGAIGLILFTDEKTARDPSKKKG